MIAAPEPPANRCRRFGDHPVGEVDRYVAGTHNAGEPRRRQHLAMGHAPDCGYEKLDFRNLLAWRGWQPYSSCDPCGFLGGDFGHCQASTRQTTRVSSTVLRTCILCKIA